MHFTFHLYRLQNDTFIPYLTSKLLKQFQTKTKIYEDDSFNLGSIEEGERKIENILKVRRTYWSTLLNNMDMKYSSSKT